MPGLVLGTVDDHITDSTLIDFTFLWGRKWVGWKDSYSHWIRTTLGEHLRLLVMLEVIREVFLEEEKFLIDLKRKKQKNKTRKGMEAWWNRKCLWLGEY